MTTSSSIRTVLVCLSLCFTLTSCGLFDTVSSKCGSKFEPDESGFGAGIQSWDTELLDGDRIYRRSITINNVCPDEHVTASFNFAFDKDHGALESPVTVKGHIIYSLLFPTEETTLVSNLNAVDENNTTYTGSVEAGLKQTFGEDPALYVVVLEISFPTTGVESRDLDYVTEFTDVWLIKTEYFEFPGS